MALPTRRHESKPTPLTSPTSLTSRVGITRIFGIVLQREEIPEDLEAEPLAFFGMELDSEDPPAGDRRDESAAIGRHRDHVLLVVADQMIAVDEVEIVARIDPGEQRRGTRERDLVPADVRDAMVLAGRLEPADFTVDPAQALRQAALVASRREQLHTEADAEKRNPADHRLLTQDPVEAALSDVADAVAEGADAGQHDVRRVLDVLGAVGHARTAAALFDRPRHRVEVPHSIVDHRHTFHGLS